MLRYCGVKQAREWGKSIDFMCCNSDPSPSHTDEVSNSPTHPSKVRSLFQTERDKKRLQHDLNDVRKTAEVFQTKLCRLRLTLVWCFFSLTIFDLLSIPALTVWSSQIPLVHWQWMSSYALKFYRLLMKITLSILVRSVPIDYKWKQWLSLGRRGHVLIC